MRAHVTIQGYQDGVGLTTEFDLLSMSQELEDTLRETLDLGHDEQNALSVWDAWERRTVDDVLRTALRVAQQAVTGQAAGG